VTAEDRAAGPAHQLWGGRFTGSLAEAADCLNRSLPVDQRLWPQDVRVAQAWVSMLAQVDVLSPAEERSLIAGLARVADRLAAGVAADAPDEDVHTLVERLLYEEVGEVAGKLNTGRSRNDQVATDLRLWALEVGASVSREVAALGSALVEQAERSLDLLLPGYTHGQRAQPVRWGYVLAAHAWPLVRDLARLREAAERASELPLGAGALAGSGIPVDREYLRRALGFQRIAGNGLDVTGDRDFVADLLYALAMIGVHVSRLATELVTYASSEYGFVRLADAYSTGSSLMPQKRNPDIFELARAKSARVIGGLTGVLTLLRGLPAGYSKDLQEDKGLVFDAVDTVLATLPAVRGAVETLEPRADRMAAALDQSLLATDVADALMRTGLPFRESHAVVGRLIRLGEDRGSDFTAVPRPEAATLHPALPEVLDGLGSWEQSIERRATAGASSRDAVRAQLSQLERLFA
jgi:argininosuccinate lyase